jgi:probable phosphoglycerate mutase
MALSRPGGRRRATPPTLIVLVRHGTTATTGKELPGRAPGLHLSELGEQQAKAAATRLGALQDGKDRQVAGVYASPLERTRETAQPIGDAVGCEVKLDDGLLELDIGEWTGMELAAARKKPEWKAIQRYPSGFRFPGGESFADVQARMITTLDRMRRDHPGGIVVAVSHADPIRVAVAHALGTHLDLFQRIVVSPCSLTAVLYGDDGPTVLSVNATDDTRSFIPQ